MHCLIRISRLKKIRALIVFTVMSILYSVHSQTATNDFFMTASGTTLNVPAPGILTNDTGGTLTAILVNGATNGTLTLNASGAFVYTPTNNFTGVDGFTYKTSNGSQTSSVASVIIMVDAPGELFYDNFSRPTNGGPILPWVQETTTNVLHTGNEGSVGVLGVWNVSNQVMNATSPPNCYGYVYYSNANWTNYTVQSQIRFSSTSAASAGILGRLNPVTGAHYAAWVYPENSTEQYSPHNGKAVLLLIKYSTWTLYTVFGYTNALPGVGTNWHTLKLGFQANTISCYYDNLLLTNITDNGSLDGTPAYTNGGIGFNMWTIPSYPYTFSVDNAIVSNIVVSVANNNSYNDGINTTLQIPAPGILANDSGNGPLTALLISNPSNGSLTLTNNGGFSYTPTNGFTGTDSFTYQCTDGQTTSSVATVYITVSNSPPVANNNFYNSTANSILYVGQPGVLANDSGGSGPLTAVLASPPANGSLILTNNGGFSYTPATNFIGMDNFTYQCTDGQTTSAVATAAISITPQGGLFYDNFSRPTNASSIFPWTLEVTTPVPSVIPSPSGIWMITNNSMMGTSYSLYTYTIAYVGSQNWTNYSVQAQFQISSTNAIGSALAGRLNPATGARYSAWIYPENAPETIAPGLASMAIYKYENWTTYTEGNLILLPGLGTNQHTVKLSFVGNQVLAYFDGVLVTNWTDNGTFDGQPAFLNGGIDVETYKNPVPYTTTVDNVAVKFLNGPPAAKNNTYIDSSNPTLSVSSPGILANDTGGSGPLTAVLASPPANGSLILTNNGGFSYTPATNFTGMDSYTYQCTDGQTTSSVATVAISVTPPGGYFFDNFARLTNDNTIFPWVNELGAWSITNNILSGTCSPNNYGCVYYSAKWTDYEVQAQVQCSSTNAWGGAVGGRLNPATGARYDVWVYPENSPWGPKNGKATLQIIKYETWVNYSAQNLILIPAMGTNWHNVKVAFRGTNVFAYYDGNQITNLLDNGAFDGYPALTSGGIDISIYGTNPTVYPFYVSNVIAAPLVLNPTYSTSENTALTLTKPGVLTNDLDVYGTNLTAVLLAGPTNGTLNLSSNGGFTYTPAANFSGTDGFTIQVSDKLNYLGVATAAISVLPATNTLTVTVNNTNRLYGATNPTFTVSYSGFVNGDTTNVLSGTPSLTTGANTNSPVGSYTITNGNGAVSAANYKISYINGVLTVNPTPLQVIPNNITREYGMTNPPLTFTYVGFVNGQNTNNLSGTNGALNTSAINRSPAGVSVITNKPGSLTESNYLITYSNGTLTVTQAVLTVTAISTNRNYGATNPVFTVNYTGFAFSQGTNVLQGAPYVTTSATMSSPNGTYPIVITNGTLLATNYSFNFVNGVLTVAGGPPQLGGLKVSSNQLVFGWQSVSNQTYQVQYTTNLTAANWMSLGNVVTGTGKFMSVTNSLSGAPQRFYRLQAH